MTTFEYSQEWQSYTVLTVNIMTLYDMYKCQNICIKNKTIIYAKVLFWFLPNLKRLNKIMKSVKSTNNSQKKKQYKKQPKKWGQSVSKMKILFDS